MVITILPSGRKLRLYPNIYLMHTNLHCFEYHHHVIPFWTTKHLDESATVLCTGVSPWMCQPPSLGGSLDWCWQTSVLSSALLLCTCPADRGWALPRFGDGEVLSVWESREDLTEAQLWSSCEAELQKGFAGWEEKHSKVRELQDSPLGLWIIQDWILYYHWLISVADLLTIFSRKPNSQIM